MAATVAIGTAEVVRVDVTSILSAGAATLAAVLAGLNLLLTTRRAERQWARDSAIDAIVEFLDASFDVGLTCMDAHEERESGTPLGNLDALRERVRAAHDLQVHNLTKLMVLAPGDVVEAAEKVHYVDHELVNATFGKAMAKLDDLDRVDARLRPARHRLIDASRQSLHVRGAARPTYPRRWWRDEPPSLVDH